MSFCAIILEFLLALIPNTIHTNANGVQGIIGTFSMAVQDDAQKETSGAKSGRRTVYVVTPPINPIILNMFNTVHVGFGNVQACILRV